MDVFNVSGKTVVARKGLSTMFTRIILQSQVLRVVVVIPVSFLGESFSTLTANIVLDTHVGFQVPTQVTQITKLPTTKLARLLLELKLVSFLLSDSTIIDFVSQGVFVQTFPPDKSLTT